MSFPISDRPVTMFNTPAGKPASTDNSPNRNAVSDVRLAGFQTIGVAACQRRAQLPRGQQQREIPGNDQADDADWFAQGVGEGGLDRVDRLAMNLRGPARIVAENVDHHGHVDVAGLENRLAVVEGFEFGELVDVLFEQVGETPDQSSALAGGHLAPGAAAVFESAASCLHRAVYVGRGGFRNLGQNLTSRGIDGVELFRGVGPLTVDEQAPGRKLCLRSCNHLSSNH